MDGGEKGCDELLGEAVVLAFLYHRGEDAVPAGGLDNGDVVRLLELAYPAGDLHSGTKGHKQVLVDDVNLGTELLDAFVIFLVIGDLLTDGQALKQSLQI